MYINFKYLSECGITPMDLVWLVAIRQRDDFIMQAAPGEKVKEFIDSGLVEVLKSGITRLTKKGATLVNYAETPNMNDEVADTLSEMIKIYESNSKDIGISRKEAESRLCWFMGNTSFKKQAIVPITEQYVEDSGEYTMSLCNFIWKPSSQVFTTHMTLRTSKLFDLIVERFGMRPDLYMETKKSREMEWLFAVSALPNPPVKANPDWLFTGSSASDKGRIKNIKTYLLNKLRQDWK